MDTDDVFLSFTLLVTVVAVRTCYPCILGISLYPLLLKSRLILQYSICIVLHSKDTIQVCINESAVPGSRQLRTQLDERAWSINRVIASLSNHTRFSHHRTRPRHGTRWWWCMWWRNWSCPHGSSASPTTRIEKSFSQLKMQYIFFGLCSIAWYFLFLAVSHHEIGRQSSPWTWTRDATD